MTTRFFVTGLILISTLLGGAQGIQAQENTVTARERLIDFLVGPTAPPTAATIVEPEPAIVEPALVESAVVEPIAPIAQDPVFQEPVFQEPVFQEPALDEPTTEEAPVAEPAFVEPDIADATPAPPEALPSSAATDLFSEAEIMSTRPQALSAQERADSAIRDFSSPALSSTISTLDRLAGPESYGFFTPARRYIAQRGQDPAPRLTLRYGVTTKNALTAAIGPKSTVDIIIGPDYAAISKRPDETIIYDFKTHRVLNINAAEKTFTNASLYAVAYRNIDSVTKMTEGGTKRTLKLGAGKLGAKNTLDSFFLESALGYAAAPIGSALNVVQADGKITADFNDERVFSAMLNGPKLKDYRQAYSFIGLLYHSEPVHPAILAELKDVRAAPNALTFHSAGPKYPDGQIITWTLKSKISETGAFPLPANVKSVTERKSVSPMGFIIAEALSGRALGGAPDPASMLTAIKQRLDADDPLSAWVSAQSLKDRLSGCEALSGLCAALRKAEAGASDDPELATLVKAFKQLKSKSSRTAGLSALKPMMSALDAPSLVLRTAAIALAKTPKSELEEAGLSTIDPTDLLAQAIARNPYDLLAYQGLAQIRASRGDFIKSWDMNDTLRAFADVPPKLTAPINRAEAKLATRAPGFFPPVNK